MLTRRQLWRAQNAACWNDRSLVRILHESHVEGDSSSHRWTQDTEFQTLLTSPQFALPLTMLYPPTGKRLGFTIDSGKFHNVSLGQGQETVAEKALEKASKQGHWVLLQVSITSSWKTLGMNTRDGQYGVVQANGNDPSSCHTVICRVLRVLSVLMTPPKLPRDSADKDSYHLLRNFLAIVL